MNQFFEGRVWKLGDDIDTDIIIPTQYLILPTIDEMKKYTFSPLRPELAELVQPGDILLAGKNFGCGSSREQASEVLVALNFSCVIAKSYARIFYRNAINNGLLLIESKDVPDNCEEGDRLAVEINKSISCNGESFSIPEIPENLYRLIDDGGLVKSMQKKNKIGDR